MKKFLIISLTLILTLIFLFWLFVFYGIIDRTMLNSLGKYPNSTSWATFRNTGIPTYMGLSPGKAGSGARFDTNDNYSRVFSYYDNFLKNKGWREAPISSGTTGYYDIASGVYNNGDFRYKLFNKNTFGITHELRIQIYNCPNATGCGGTIIINSALGN